MDPAVRRRLSLDVARLGAGDRSVASSVFTTLWPLCLQLARAALHNEADAHDAAQNALMKLFAEVARFDPARSAVGWALALTTWECRTIRQQHRRRRVDDGADLDVIAGAIRVDADVIDRLTHAADVAVVAAAFVDLDAGDQQTLTDLLDGVSAGGPRDRKRRQRALERLRTFVFGSAPATIGDDHG